MDWSGLRRYASGFVLALVGAVTVFSQVVPETTYQDLRWRMIGPFRGGRTRAAAGVPSQPNLFYVGAVNGGVWKTDDAGRTWNPIFDDQSTQSVGAIAIAPSDPNIIYVGSGEGLHRPDLSVGNGIYRSADAGKTWAHLGLRDGWQIPGLSVDPRDPNRLFAAVLGHPYGPSEERGIFRSTDGGQTWTRILFKNENTGGSFIELDPSNPDIIYAALWEARQGPWEDNNLFNGTAGGLFKSSDGGNTWRQLSGGLPKDLAQINVAIATSNPKRMYASAAAASGPLGIYRSDDAGENWLRITEDARPAGRIGGGDLSVPKVDPTNPDIVYCASTVTMRSTDGGKTWSGFRGAPGGDDYQNLWINPQHPNIILLAGDQGALVTVNGGASWSSWYNQPTAQIYHVATTNTFPYRVCGGQQESGSVCISTRGNDGAINIRDWHPVGVIEYGYAAPDPLDPDVIYGGGRSEVSRFHFSTGQVQNITPIPIRSPDYRTDRTEPLMFSPVDPHTLYYAANVLFKTTDRGQSWQTISPDLTREKPDVPASVGVMIPKGAEKQRGVIYALAPSFKNINVLWAGTDDGQVWRTVDAGTHWSNITPPELTSWSKVTQIAASHFNEETAYISVSRFRINDNAPYIYRTRDGGKSWTRIISGLPEFGPVDTVREDTVRKGLLFAGTENSVWTSFDSGDHWQPLQLNLPHTSMRDLWIHDDDLIVATHGRGFWVLDDISPLREAAETPLSQTHLFTPAPAYRVQRDTYTDTPIPPDEPMASNPPDGAVIDYLLPQASKSAVVLEISDSKGELVRRFSSDDKAEISDEELRSQLIPPYWVLPPHILSHNSGHHRFVWDLHYPSPVSTSRDYPIAAVPHRTPRYPLGPTALPGHYTVRLTADGKSYTAPLTVRMDPRVKASPEALAQKFQAESALAHLTDGLSKAAFEAGSLSKQIEKLGAPSSSAAQQATAAFQKKLAEVSGSGRQSGPPADQPTLARESGRAAVLYGLVWQADAEPTLAQTAVLHELEKNSSTVLDRWQHLKSVDLPALNEALQHGGLPKIAVDPNAASGEASLDEE